MSERYSYSAIYRDQEIVLVRNDGMEFNQQMRRHKRDRGAYLSLMIVFLLMGPFFIWLASSTYTHEAWSFGSAILGLAFFVAATFFCAMFADEISGLRRVEDEKNKAYLACQSSIFELEKKVAEHARVMKAKAQEPQFVFKEING